MNVNNMEPFRSKSSSSKENNNSPQAQHTTPVNGQDETQWKALNAVKTTNSEGYSDDIKNKRRVAVCDATDEAKESRCHMRVIMKKF